MPKMAVGVVEVVGDGFNGTNKGAVVEESWKPAPEMIIENYDQRRIPLKSQKR